MQTDKIVELVNQAYRQVDQLSETLSQLEGVIKDLTDKNTRLEMTNQELRQLLVQRSQTDSADQSTNQDQQPAYEPLPVSGKERLQEFYNDGVHVCHPYFGTRRLPNEECIFCQGIINSLD